MRFNAHGTYHRDMTGKYKSNSVKLFAKVQMFSICEKQQKKQCTLSLSKHRVDTHIAEMGETSVHWKKDKHRAMDRKRRKKKITGKEWHRWKSKAKKKKSWWNRERTKTNYDSSVRAHFVSIIINVYAKSQKICHGSCILLCWMKLCTVFMAEVVRHEVKFVVCLLFLWHNVYRKISQDKQ